MKLLYLLELQPWDMYKLLKSSESENRLVKTWIFACSNHRFMALNPTGGMIFLHIKMDYIITPSIVLIYNFCLLNSLFDIITHNKDTEFCGIRREMSKSLPLWQLQMVLMLRCLFHLESLSDISCRRQLAWKQQKTEIFSKHKTLLQIYVSD